MKERAGHVNITALLALIEPRREKTGFLHMRKQRRRSAHTKLCRGNLARELMQFFRQISLIGLRGCFPVVHCGNNLKAQRFTCVFVSIIRLN